MSRLCVIQDWAAPVAGVCSCQLWGAHLANSAATAFSLSPTYLENSSGPLTARKLAPASPATARPVAQEAGAPQQQLGRQQWSDTSELLHASTAAAMTFNVLAAGLQAAHPTGFWSSRAARTAARRRAAWLPGAPGPPGAAAATRLPPAGVEHEIMLLCACDNPNGKPVFDSLKAMHVSCSCGIHPYQLQSETWAAQKLRLRT